MAELADDAQLCLASASPRRRALLEGLGLRLLVQPADLTERRQGSEAPNTYAARMAAQKARCVRDMLDGRGREALPVLAADTCVVIDGLTLGKPRDRDHCLAMLRRLSGRTHDVITAVAVASGDSLLEAMSVSHVTFRRLDEPCITRYWESGEPVGKAGGYAVQGLAGGFVSRLEGSYTGVVGLPLYESTVLLEKIGVHWL